MIENEPAAGLRRAPLWMSNRGLRFDDDTSVNPDGQRSTDLKLQKELHGCFPRVFHNRRILTVVGNGQKKTKKTVDGNRLSL